MRVEENLVELEEGVVDVRPSRLLVVDGSGCLSSALRRALQDEYCTFIDVGTGSEAIEVLAREEIAVIVCNAALPDMETSTFLKKALAQRPQAVRVIMTESSQVSSIVDLINIGQISFCLVSPWDEKAIRETMCLSLKNYKKAHDKEKLQELIVAQHRNLSRTHESLRHELKIGGRIHDVLLMGQVPQDIPGVEIDVTTIPTQEIDGDFYDFYPASSRMFDVVIGDVMGKGLPAALVGTAVKTQLMRFAVPIRAAQIFHREGSWQTNLLTVEEILTKVHLEVASQLIELEFFVSLFYGRFNLKKRTFQYVDCGFTKPLHYQAESKKIESLTGADFPLGMVEEAAYRSFERKFSPGDLFVFYSDGVTEAKDASGQLFGVERLMSLLESNAEAAPSEILIIIKQAVMAFAQKHRFDDDLTLIVIKILPLGNTEECVQTTAKFSSELSQLSVARNFVHRFCQKASGNTILLSDQLQLAINEAICNIVKHGYKGESHHEMILRAEIGEEGVLLEVLDQGDAFDPSTAPEPSLAGDTEGGFGVFIIREIADRLVYLPKQTEGGWNSLQIYKKYFLQEDRMDICHDIREKVLVITLKGEHLDAKDVSNFKQKVLDLLTYRQDHNVVFDMNNLQFIDSSGLGSFLSILRHVNSRGGDLKLAQVTKPIRAMFEIVRMHKLFEIFNSLDDAVHSFK